MSESDRPDFKNKKKLFVIFNSFLGYQLHKHQERMKMSMSNFEILLFYFCTFFTSLLRRLYVSVCSSLRCLTRPTRNNSTKDHVCSSPFRKIFACVLQMLLDNSFCMYRHTHPYSHVTCAMQSRMSSVLPVTRFHQDFELACVSIFMIMNYKQCTDSSNI